MDEQPYVDINVITCINCDAGKGHAVSTNDTFLAIFLGSKTSTSMTHWKALPEAEQKAKMQKGMDAWRAWVERHKDNIVVMGGPLGKTKKINPNGIEDEVNEMTAFCVVRAKTHEAAANMFEKHPHFMIFPGESVEVMPVLPIPKA